MWKPPINYITLHYAYILTFGILAIIIIYPYGNLQPVDAYFFGVSASTESGLNTVDVSDLKTYQQVFIYIVPIITNLGFVNIVVVIVRLRWFRQRFKQIAAKKPTKAKRYGQNISNTSDTFDLEGGLTETVQSNISDEEKLSTVPERSKDEALHVKFSPDLQQGNEEKPSRPIPSLLDVNEEEDKDAIKISPTGFKPSNVLQQRKAHTCSLNSSTSIDRAVSSIFVLGSTTSHISQGKVRGSEPLDLASLSREELGGIEYSALRVLLKITAVYFFGLHIFGVMCLLPWIHTANSKYKDYLASQGQDKTWWAFYSAQTMIDNLGFTLTPDSMVSFRDATWPMLLMSSLAFAGNTFYPCFLRLFVWAIFKLAPASSSLKESVRFLLDHPRRCYTLLFPSSVTWTLAGVLVVLNFIDVLLIITLDLENPELTTLPVGPRILAAIFQAASSRHTGTSTFNLANVNPAVQFSLLVMMYISIYPIAISIRMSNSYEENPVGIYGGDENLDERKGKAYLLGHMRNQLSFDLWYIFLGVFCICAAESKRIMDAEDTSFHVFAIFFEVVSAYGNVGLSLGHSDNLTSLCGHFSTFGKLVICAMMIRGRHRGMPYSLDRAITLPGDRLAEPAEGEYGHAHERPVEKRNSTSKTCIN
ncbi:potassium transport protein 1 [Dendryphion nanum]|uniref:Potassium transport protein 1 n=1 Tax=Dendryphion nanum TaxID=256645 RepID=A0A9P9I819_9PLEO|nr:potassium transport protein 1 [Dendryphion nanum]